MPLGTTKQAANVNTKNPPTINEDESGITSNTANKAKERETLEEQRVHLQKYLAEVCKENEI